MESRSQTMADYARLIRPTHSDEMSYGISCQASISVMSRLFTRPVLLRFSNARKLMLPSPCLLLCALRLSLEVIAPIARPLLAESVNSNGIGLPCFGRYTRPLYVLML